MSKETTLPLKDVMGSIDRKNKNYYHNLTQEQKKAFVPWMMMRYCSSVQGKNASYYIFMTNELVNYQFMEVNKHPELQWLLLSACGSGKVEFHPYIKPPNGKKKKDKVSEFLISLFPHLKSDEIAMLKNINSTDELKQLARENGYDDKSIKDIFG